MTNHQVNVIYRNLTTRVMAVFSVNVDVFNTSSTAACYASKVPMFVVICHRGVSVAFDMSGKKQSLEKLCHLAPELQQHL